MKIVSVSDASRAQNDAQRTTLRIENGVPAAPVSSTPEAPDPTSDRRAILERELDRLQHALQVDQQSAGQHLNWLLLSQALFVNAFLIVLVLGSRVPLPFAKWLLVGLAALGVVAALTLHTALRRAREEIAMLRLQRRAVEMSLQQEFGRAPMFPPIRSEAPSAVVPAIFISGWTLLVAYALLMAR